MSKTTIVLLCFLIIVLGVLFYILYGPRNSTFINSMTAPIRSAIAPVNTSLSFSTGEQIIQPGQTVSVAVLIHNPKPHPSLIQLEISYDPTMLTVDSLMPGQFFTNPMVALQNIDPSTGRISYALHCPGSELSNNIHDCVRGNSDTVAMITFISNRYAFKNSTSLSFLPKTVIRTGNGRDILHTSNSMTLTFGKSLLPIASSSAVASAGAMLHNVSPH